MHLKGLHVAATISTGVLRIDLGHLSGGVDVEDMSPNYRLSKISMPKGRVSRMCFGAFDIVRGSIALIPADTQVRRVSSGEYARYVSCYLNRDWLESAGASNCEWKLDDFEHCTNIQSAELERVFRLMAKEVRYPGFASDVLLEGLGLEAVAALYRHFDRRHRNGCRQKGGLSTYHIRQVCEFVEASMGVSIRVDEVARICRMSDGHFRRSFKQSTGRTFFGYVEEVRLNHAKRLLSGTQMPIHLIAQQLGFSNNASFSKAFRRAVNESPRSFRSGH